MLTLVGSIVVSLLVMLGYVYAFYGFYLIYCTLRRTRDSGKLDRMPRYVRWISWSYIYVGVILDWLFNMTFGALAFWEWPWKYGVWSLFTARCKAHRIEEGWRMELAVWVCEGWLNPHEDHC